MGGGRDDKRAPGQAPLGVEALLDPRSPHLLGDGRRHLLRQLVNLVLEVDGLFPRLFVRILLQLLLGSQLVRVVQHLVDGCSAEGHDRRLNSAHRRVDTDGRFLLAAMPDPEDRAALVAPDARDHMVRRERQLRDVIRARGELRRLERLGHAPARCLACL